MSNHGPNPFPEGDGFKRTAKRNKLMRELLTTTGFRGALGDFPEGKITEDDEGSIQFAIGSEGDKVVLDFGTSVHWVAMSPQQAADLASALLKRAREVGRKNGVTISVTIG